MGRSNTETDETFADPCLHPFLARASILSDRKQVTACSMGRTGEHSALRTAANPAASKSLSSSLWLNASPRCSMPHTHDKADRGGPVVRERNRAAHSKARARELVTMTDIGKAWSCERVPSVAALPACSGAKQRASGTGRETRLQCHMRFQYRCACVPYNCGPSSTELPRR